MRLAMRLMLGLALQLQLQGLQLESQALPSARLPREIGRARLLSTWQTRAAHLTGMSLRPMRGGEGDSLMSVEDDFASGDEESSSPAFDATKGPGSPHDVGHDVTTHIATEHQAGESDLDSAGQNPEDYGAVLPDAGAAAGGSAAAGSYQREYKIRPAVTDKYKGKTGEAFEFQLLDVDYKKLPYKRPGAPRAGPVECHEGGFTINAFGTSSEGHSVHVAIKGFLPYFFVNTPREFSEEECEAFTCATNNRIAKQSGGWAGEEEDDRPNAVIRCASLIFS
jgi:hypothetical protein